MYHPTTRLLTILELLQAHPMLSGEELARRLEVEPRSVRRYITMLQDMGMPIVVARGPGGGYQLRPGFKLPPLMFSEEEATALVLGLLGTSWLELGQPALSVAGALAKVLRVLPVRARERLSAVATQLVLSPGQHENRPAASVLIELSDAIQRRERLEIAYRSHGDVVTRRTVEPYAVAGWWGRWYLVAYCCLRQGYRLFRLDRVQELRGLGESFTPDAAFEVETHLREQLGRRTARWHIVVEFQAALYTVQQQVPASYGAMEEIAGGARFETWHGDLGDFARFLVTRNLPFVVREPPELRVELLRMAAAITRGASGPETAGNPP
jgi:predicted DNA-binding transcriptional regulator YafY